MQMETKVRGLLLPDWVVETAATSDGNEASNRSSVLGPCYPPFERMVCVADSFFEVRVKKHILNIQMVKLKVECSKEPHK